MRWRAGVAVVCFVSVVVLGGVVGTARAGGSDLAVAYQINVAHSGVQTDSSLIPPFSRQWQVSLPGQVEYPLIANGDVYVTAGNGPTMTLYALDQHNGGLLWSQPVPSRYSVDAYPAYDAGRIFVVHNDVNCCSDGLMDAFDASTGAHLWSTSLPGQFSFSSPPTASNGVVYTSGSGLGGTLYAVDEASGALLATQPVENGDDSSPALSAGGVFVQYACDQVYGFAQQSLAPLWHYSGPCEGGGGNTVAYADGDVFTHDYYGNLILDAATGNPIGSWFPSGPSSSRPPAVDSNALFFVNQGVLVAQDLASGAQKWAFPGDGNLEPQPIVIATPSGEYVVIDSSAGNLYAVNAANGQLVWSGNLGTTIPNFPRLAAGQGLLVAPAGNVLTAYTAAPPPHSVTLTPADAVNTVGTSHTVTASVTAADGSPVSGSQVLFSVQGSVTTSGTCTTDPSGACAFTYQGPQLPGADVITACADANRNGSADPSEPCATATKAWVAPTTTAGHVTGGGQIPNATGTDNDAFGFTAQSDSNGVKGECNLVDPSANLKIKCLDVTTLTESGTHATLFGDAIVNGTATTYRIDVDDLAEPGAGQDKFKLQTGNGYTAGGILASGNVQVH